jgi:phosphoribosyl-ATP pyrophosphohydrolase
MTDRPHIHGNPSEPRDDGCLVEADRAMTGQPQPEVTAASPLSDDEMKELLAELGEAFVDQFLAVQAKNWKGWVVERDGERYECQVQRLGGLSTTEKIIELNATIDQLRAKVAELEVQTECNPMQSAVRAWHEKFGVVVGASVAIRRPKLRANLIEEEARETTEAIRRGDLTEAVDGMCDVLYVVFGTAVEWGLNLQPFFDEVHRTNMLKVGGATRDDGKILKPEGWQPPRIGAMLADLTREEIARRKGAK